MTCIVALKTESGIYMGGDAAAVGAGHYNLRRDPKVFRNGPALIGYTTSFRMGQVLQHGFEMPKRGAGENLMRYMCISVVDAMRHALKQAGFVSIKDSVETAGNFLMAYDGELFEIERDWQVARLSTAYAAVGSGAETANGALFVMGRDHWPDPELCLHQALHAAEAHCTGVRAPFTVLQLEKDDE